MSKASQFILDFILSEEITSKLRSKAEAEGIDMLDLKRARKSVINYLQEISC